MANLIFKTNRIIQSEWIESFQALALSTEVV